MTGEAGVTVVDIIGSAPRGSHLSVFHETKEDLLDVLIPYFQTGLEKGEFCLWITSDAVTEEEAESAMRKSIANSDFYFSDQRIEIVSGQKWQPKRESSARRTVIEACQARLDHALARGLAGMRASWGMWPVDKRKRRAYLQYEERITQWLRPRKVLMLCGYPVAECGAGDLLDITAVHDCAISLRHGKTSILKPLQRGRHDRLTQAKRAEEQIAAYEGRLRSLASELVLAEERERQKIAANLHDSVSQLLTAAKSRLATLKTSVHLPNAVKQFTLINELLAEAIMDTRLLVYDLSPPVLYTMGLQATLEWFAKRVLVQHGVRVHLVDDQLAKPLDEDMLVLLFSAVRELVYNAVKHAQVGQIKVSVERDDSTIRITVCDEGVGFDIATIGSNYDVTGGFGLFSIRERLANLGGDFKINSSIGFGTTVTLIAPLKSGTSMAA